MKNYDNDKEVLSRSKRFAVAIPLIPALIYGLISGTVGVAVGAGVSKAVRAGQLGDAPVVMSKDYSEYPDYSAKPVWQAIYSEPYYD